MPGILAPMSKYLDAVDHFTATANAITDWNAATPCEGWVGTDVINHMLTAQRHIFETNGADLGAEPSGDGAARWAAHAAAVRPYASDPAFLSKEFEGRMGPSTVEATLESMIAFDVLVHAWDISANTANTVQYTPAELAFLDEVISGLPPAAFDGPAFGKPVEAPAGANAADKLMARIGRKR